MRNYYASLEEAVREPSRGKQLLDGLLHPACPCREILTVLADEAARGRHADYTFALTNLSVPDSGTDNGTAHVTVAQSAGNLYDESGRVVQKISPLTQRYFINVRATNGIWQVVRVTAQ